MLRQQLNSESAGGGNNANGGTYGATNDADDAAEVDTLSYTDTQGEDDEHKRYSRR